MFQSAQKSDSKQKKDNSSGKENGSRLDPSVYFHVPDLTYGAAEVAQLKEEVDERNIQKQEEKEPQNMKNKNSNGGIIIKDEIALDLLKKCFSPEEAKFIRTKNNFVDLDLLIQGKNTLTVGGNYNSLTEIVRNSKTVEIIVTNSMEAITGEGKHISGKEVPFQFKDPINDAREWWLVQGGSKDFSGKCLVNGIKMDFAAFMNYFGLEDKYTPSGGVGKTSAPYGTKPNTEFDKRLSEKIPLSQQIFSTNDNYQVYVNKRLLKHSETKGVAVKTMAHELFGHLSAMFKGTSYSHGSVREEGPKANEWNYNKELETEIKERTNEAMVNYSKWE